MPAATLPTFTVSQFADGAGLTAADKATFATTFVRFLAAVCHEPLYTESFYRTLVQFAGHDGHGNPDAFFAVWFSDARRRAAFVRHWLYVEEPTVGLRDVASALQAWLVASDLPARYHHAALAEQNQQDLRDLDRLVRQYPNRTRTILDELALAPAFARAG